MHRKAVVVFVIVIVLICSVLASNQLNAEQEGSSKGALLFVSLHEYSHFLTQLELALYFRSQGYSVTIASTNEFRSHAEKHNINYVACGDYTEHYDSLGDEERDKLLRVFYWAPVAKHVFLSRYMYSSLDQWVGGNQVDVMFVDYLTLTAFDVADKYNIPVITTSMVPLITPFYEIGSRWAAPFVGVQRKVDNFWDIWKSERANRLNLVNTYLGKVYQNTYRAELGIAPVEGWSLQDIYWDRAYITFCFQPFSSLNILPPNVHNAGFLLHASNSSITKEVAKDELLDWLSESQDSVILISFGARLKALGEPIDAIAQFIDKNVNRFRFIWVIRDAAAADAIKQLFETFAERVWITNWVDQLVVLDQKQVKLFITHGGIGSIYEGIYSGKPMVGIPIGFDNRDNILRANEAGAMELAENTVRSLFTVTQAIFPKYRMYTRNIKRTRDIMTSKNALETVHEVVDNILAGGYAFLTPKRKPWYIEQNFDIVSAYFGIIFTIFFLFCKIVKKLIMFVVSRTSKRSSSK